MERGQDVPDWQASVNNLRKGAPRGALEHEKADAVSVGVVLRYVRSCSCRGH